jgi:hypothetical protein
MLSLIKSSLNVTRRVETVKFFHAGRMSQGFEDFFDKKVPNEAYITGRGWTLADVRRKVRLVLCLFETCYESVATYHHNNM